MAAGLIDTGQGYTYAACPASTATVVKATPGKLKAIYWNGTGTAGTVAYEDTGTVIQTVNLVTTAGGGSFVFPDAGIEMLTGIKVTTVGVGNTASVLFL